MANIARIQDMSLDDAANDWATVNRKVRALRGTIARVEDFAANTIPGTTEMAAAAQAAIDHVAAQGGGRVKFFDGQTYKISEKLEITSDNITIDVGDATIDASDLPDVVEVNRPDGLFDVVGTASATTTLSASAALNASTITVANSSGMSIGDAIFLFSSGERWYQEGAVTVTKSTVNRIMNISGNVLTLQYELDHSFDIGVASVAVTAWAGVRNFRLLGGHYIGPGYEGAHANGEGPAVLYSLYTQDIHVEGIRSAVGFQGAWMWVQKNYGGGVFNNVGRGLPDDYTDTLVEGDNTGFTGIITTESAAMRVTGNRGYRFRHLHDGSRSRDIVVDGNHAYDCHRAPFGSHLGCVDWTIANNFARSRFGGGAGILWRGHDVKVIANDLGGAIPSGSYGFYDTAGHQDDIPKTYIIIGNKFRAARTALGLYGNIGLATIEGNDISGGSESASYPAVEIGTMDLDTARIAGGRIKALNGGACVTLTANTPRTRRFVHVEGVKLEGYGTYGVASAANSTASTSLIVGRCNFAPPGTPTGHVQAAGTYDVLSLKPNYRAGAEMNLADDFGGEAFTLTLSDGTNTATHSLQRITWTYRDGVFSGVFALRITSKGSLSGALRITGWPVPPESGAAGGGQVAFASDLNLAAAGQTIALQPIGGSDRVDLYLNDATTGTTPLQASEIGNSFRVEGSIFYTA